MIDIFIDQPIFILIFVIIASLFSLTFFSKYLIEGSINLANRLNINTLIIGTIVVGMGTSIDELIVNLTSLSSEISTDVIVGNIIGSNLVNLTLGIGIPAIITILSANTIVIEKEIALYLGVTAILTSFAADGRITIIEGILLFTIFNFVMILFYQYHKSKKTINLNFVHYLPIYHGRSKNILNNIVYVIGGLLIMIISAKIFVEAASILALKAGLSQYFIGVVIVGIGTSLPEIVASIQAAIRGKSDIVLGNVLGSNIFNITFALSIPSILKNIYVSKTAQNDIYLLNILGIVVIFLLLFDTEHFGGRRNINRLGGFLIITIYLFFILHKLGII